MYETIRKISEFLEEAYKEREIYYRSGGRVRFVRLGKYPQVALTVTAVLLLGWIGFTTGGMLYLSQSIHQAGANYRTLIDAKDSEISRLQTGQQDLQEHLQQTQDRFLSITRELEHKQRVLRDLIVQRTKLESELRDLGGVLDATTRQRLDAVKSKRQLHSRLVELETKLYDAASIRAKLTGSLQRTEESLSGTMEKWNFERRRNAALNKRLDVKTSELGDTRSRKLELERTLAATRQTATLLTQERDATEQARRTLAARVDELETRLASVRQSQNDMIARIRNSAERQIDELEAVIGITGLDIDRLIERIADDETGIGGPLVGLPDIDTPRGDSQQEASQARSAENTVDFEQAMGMLEHRLTRWATLNSAMERIPLSAPLDTFHTTSSYGKRRDPFAKRWAMHAGVDLSGPVRSNVHSTAAGQVVFVGWKGPYGRMVEVDHGYGLKTRYGHLRRILVKRGQKVAYRDIIGVLGSSGRSTGRHLHYEVRFDDTPIDPEKFLKAGKYVFKN